MAEPWWKSAVVYQIYPRSFADSTGDGIGDLAGIEAHLDHLADLGVDVIWLSPVYPSPWDDGGYDIAEYRGIEPTFGTLDDFDRLLTAVHARGLKLVMDLVVNHTSDEHPWFVESRSSTDNPKRDWYWWRPPRYGMDPGAPGGEPTNWASFFSGPTWELDEATGEYYLHLFSRKQPDLNWENPAVRAAIFEMMRWWLERGVDGFRMDVINMISKDPALPDGRVHAGEPYGDGGEFFIDGPRLHEYLQEMHRAVLTRDDLLTVGEMPGVTVDEARLFTDPARGEIDMVFQFEHVGLDQAGSKWDLKPLDLRDLKVSFGRWQAGLADVGWNSLYWDNHDQPRIVSRWGDGSAASAKTLGTLLHLHRGTPYVFQGEEIGMTNYPWTSIADFRDIESVNHYADALARGVDPADVLVGLRARSRDNARTPMQWDASPQAGFTTGTPWLAVNPDHTDINVAAQASDPHSVLAHYKRLIALRHDEPVVAYGAFTMLLPEDEQVYAFTRTYEGVELLVLCNVSAQPASFELDDPAPWSAATLLLGTHGTPGTGSLQPWESRVLRRPLP